MKVGSGGLRLPHNSGAHLSRLSNAYLSCIVGKLCKLGAGRATL